MNPIDKDIVNDIREEIATKITNSSSVFGAVYAYPKATLSGFPAVIVMPSENDSDYGSTETRRMQFVFRLHIYYPLQKEADYQQTEEAIGEAVGEILRIFTGRQILTNCDWVTPIPSIWGETSVGEANYRTAEVILNCVKYVSLD